MSPLKRVSAFLESLPGIRRRKKRVLTRPEQLVTLQVGNICYERAPREMRCQLWLSCLHKGIGQTACQQYKIMLNQNLPEDAAVDIDKDLDRTFPGTVQFNNPAGQQALRRVLRAYAAYDPDVGYCQGMNFLAALLLMYLPQEEDAFGALVMLMFEQGLRQLYSRTMVQLQVQLWLLTQLMPPELSPHLEACAVPPLLYAASWLMTCFSADFPISFSARILDVVLSDRCSYALLRVSVHLLEQWRGKLLGLDDMEDLLGALKVDMPGCHEDVLHDMLTDAFRSRWSGEQQAMLAAVDGARSLAEAQQAVAQLRCRQGEGPAAAAAAAAAACSLSAQAASPCSSTGGAAAADASSSSHSAAPQAGWLQLPQHTLSTDALADLLGLPPDTPGCCSTGTYTAAGDPFADSSWQAAGGARRSSQQQPGSKRHTWHGGQQQQEQQQEAVQSHQQQGQHDLICLLSPPPAVRRASSARDSPHKLRLQQLIEELASMPGPSFLPAAAQPAGSKQRLLPPLAPSHVPAEDPFQGLLRSDLLQA